MSDYWKDNNIKKPQAVVICAACIFDDVILLGARHWDVRMRQQYNMMHNSEKWRKYSSSPEPDEFKEGFINQFGEFLTREEAMKVAKQAKQKIDIKQGCGGSTDTLFSEGLY